MVSCQQERDVKLMEKATNGQMSTRMKCDVGFMVCCICTCLGYKFTAKCNIKLGHYRDTRDSHGNYHKTSL